MQRTKVFPLALVLLIILGLLVSSCADDTFLKYPYGKTTERKIIVKTKDDTPDYMALSKQLDVLAKRVTELSEHKPKKVVVYKTNSAIRPTTLVHRNVNSKKNLQTSYPYQAKGAYQSYERLKLGDSIEKEFYNAYAYYRVGNFALSIVGFSNFIKKYPTHYLADDALFMIGECYYGQREYFLAIDQYNELISRYPSSDKLPLAYLKIGFCYKNLRNFDQARAYLKELVKKFPNTKEAYIAKVQLRYL